MVGLPRLLGRKGKEEIRNITYKEGQTGLGIDCIAVWTLGAGSSLCGGVTVLSGCIDPLWRRCSIADGFNKDLAYLSILLYCQSTPVNCIIGKRDLLIPRTTGWLPAV